jgi:hypothetical protein
VALHFASMFVLEPFARVIRAQGDPCLPGLPAHDVVRDKHARVSRCGPTSQTQHLAASSAAVCAVCWWSRRPPMRSITHGSSQYRRMARGPLRRSSSPEIRQYARASREGV